MVHIVTDRYTPARLALDELSRAINTARIARNHFDIPRPHHGKEFESAAIEFAQTSHELEQDYRAQVFATAAEISLLHRTNWREDRDMLRLWHRLAITVKDLGDHPDPHKRVATLSHGKNGEMDGFNVTRIPAGIPLEDVEHGKGLRGQYRMCSEKLRIAELLGIELVFPGFSSSQKERRDQLKNSVQRMLTTTIETAKTNRTFKTHSFHITTSPCKSCGELLAALKPERIYTPLITDDVRAHFTSAKQMPRTRRELRRRGIKFVCITP